MSKKSKPIDKYITLEDALPKICKWSGEPKDAHDAIRKEIHDTGKYDRGEYNFSIISI